MIPAQMIKSYIVGAHKISHLQNSYFCRNDFSDDKAIHTLWGHDFPSAKYHVFFKAICADRSKLYPAVILLLQ